MIRNKKLLGITAGVMAVVAVAATWAFYNATHEIDNKMSTGEYGDVLTERFAPDSNWQPGQEAEKLVGVTNTGDYDLVVRIKMDESWTVAGEDTAFITIDSKNENFDDATATKGDQIDAEDGLTAKDDVNDGSVVAKTFATDFASEWTYNANDGYWYYNEVLESGEKAENFLTAITLSEDTDMGSYDETVYYINVAVANDAGSAPTFDATTWSKLAAGESLADVTVDGYYLYVYSESAVEDGKLGYSSADYILTIISETAQATEDAVAEWDVPTSITWFPSEAEA
ncbi:BsaA family SipW-dependent biofilm matrix protein [Bengtsoniella intestinalis]|uniref:BsaA family SipW-dependent biofilm matrix protein n=1 Tax=Bengtsoniella intestinalis TaxID=3073143 RepID=UPI00391FA517